MATRDVERKLTAILSADVVGYSRLMGADEEATIETLTAYRKVFLSYIDSHRGRVVDAKGDAILAEFASVMDAVKGAVEIQRELANRNIEIPDDRRMDFRIGINLGDVVVKDDAIYGDGVNVAARLEALAEPGGICISRSGYDQVKNKLKLEFEYLGEQQVKNIAEPVRAYQVDLAHAEGRPKLNSDGVTDASQAPHKGSRIPSLAVLPFKNMSGDPEQDYFADGICEDLMTDLSKISRLSVISQTTAFTYKGRSVNLKQVGKDLGVQYVLEGSVRKAGSRVRITAQLIDANTDHHLWSERYDRELQDIFEVQDEISRMIVTALDVKLVWGEQARLWRRSTQNAEAYDYFLLGRNLFGDFDRQGNARARKALETAISLDPEFSVAYATLAGFLLQDARLGWSASFDANLEKALEMARKALELDVSMADAHMVIGRYYLLKKNHKKALDALEEATRLDPTAADLYAILACTQVYAGEPERALENMAKAKQLHPNHGTWYQRTVGHAHFWLGRYEEAIQCAKEDIADAPNSLMTNVFLVAAYAAMDRKEEAQAQAGEVKRLEPDFALDEWAARALPYKKLKHLKRMIALLRKAGLE